MPKGKGIFKDCGKLSILDRSMLVYLINNKYFKFEKCCDMSYEQIHTKLIRLLSITFPAKNYRQAQDKLCEDLASLLAGNTTLKEEIIANGDRALLLALNHERKLDPTNTIGK